MNAPRSDPSSSVRPANEGDLERILEIDRLCFPEPWDYTYLKNSLGDQFLVYEDKEILGYLIAVCFYRDIKAVIMKVAVHPAHRGKGIAKALLRAVLEKLGEMKVKEVELDVKVFETGAIKLYEKFGFKTVRIRPLNENEHLYVTMRLHLPEL